MILGVDPKVGHVVASVYPACLVEGVSSGLEKMERSLVTTTDKLPAQLNELQ